MTYCRAAEFEASVFQGPIPHVQPRDSLAGWAECDPGAIGGKFNAPTASPLHMAFWGRRSSWRNTILNGVSSY